MTLDTKAIEQIGEKCKKIMSCVYQTIEEERQKPELKMIADAVDLNTFELALSKHDKNNRSQYVNKFSELEAHTYRDKPNIYIVPLDICIVFKTKSDYIYNSSKVQRNNIRVALKQAIMRNLTAQGCDTPETLQIIMFQIIDYMLIDKTNFTTDSRNFAVEVSYSFELPAQSS